MMGPVVELFFLRTDGGKIALKNGRVIVGTREEWGPFANDPRLILAISPTECIEPIVAGVPIRMGKRRVEA